MNISVVARAEISARADKNIGSSRKFWLKPAKFQARAKFGSSCILARAFSSQTRLELPH